MTPIQQRLALAGTFCAHLRYALTYQELSELISRNEADASKYGNDICHSHDFCDANMVMLDAWYETFSRHPDLNDDADIALWGDAWAIAKATDFSLIERVQLP